MWSNLQAELALSLFLNIAIYAVSYERHFEHILKVFLVLLCVHCPWYHTNASTSVVFQIKPLTELSKAFEVQHKKKFT